MESASQPHKLAIYDMDKTITKRATYTAFLMHMMLNHAPWRLVLLPILPIGLVFYTLKLWSRQRLKEFSQSLLLGRAVPLAALDQHLETYADRVTASSIYPQLLARVALEKEQGYRHVMATASYRLYVDAIAQRLGFDAVIATDLITSDTGHVLAIIDGENCYDAAKLDKIKTWMAEQKLEREFCFIRAYSDHVSDAPLLAFADEAYATNPHAPLLKLAKERGWSIIDWR